MGRPPGVTTIGILAFIAGLFGLIASVAFVTIGRDFDPGARLGGFAPLSELILPIYALLSLVLAYGFWNLRPWAWPLGIGVEVLGIGNAVLQFVYDPRQLLSLLISLAIAGVILWYLFKPEVKEALGRG